MDLIKLWGEYENDFALSNIWYASGFSVGMLL